MHVVLLNYTGIKKRLHDGPAVDAHAVCVPQSGTDAIGVPSRPARADLWPPARELATVIAWLLATAAAHVLPRCGHAPGSVAKGGTARMFLSPPRTPSSHSCHDDTTALGLASWLPAALCDRRSCAANPVTRSCRRPFPLSYAHARPSIRCCSPYPRHRTFSLTLPSRPLLL